MIISGWTPLKRVHGIAINKGVPKTPTYLWITTEITKQQKRLKETDR
jgi:hypothetical protein